MKKVKFIYLSHIQYVMRATNDYTTISVKKEIKEMLKKDRVRFQKTIGGGRWSLSDTIEEYKKMVAYATK